MHISYITISGSIISISTNTLSGTSSVITRHNGSPRMLETSCHAEIACIKKIKYHNRKKIMSKKLTLYSLAFKIDCDSDGVIHGTKMTMSKPCRSCSNQIVNNGIKNILYSDFQGNVMRIKINSLLNDTCVTSMNVSGSVTRCSEKRFIANSEISSGGIINIDLTTYYSLINIDDICQLDRGILILPRIDIIKLLRSNSRIVVKYRKNNLASYQFANIIIKDIICADSIGNLINKMSSKDLPNIWINDSPNINNTNRKKLSKIIRQNIKRSKRYVAIYFSI